MRIFKNYKIFMLIKFYGLEDKKNEILIFI